MAIDAANVADGIEAAVRLVGTPARAEGSRAYLKSDLEFVGSSVPDLRRALAPVYRTYPDLTGAEVVALAEALWSMPVFERRLAAVEVLRSYLGVLGPGDLALVERFVRDSHTWALVDSLAGDVAGALVARHGELNATLDRWIDDDDFWIRRSALLALLAPLREGGGDPERFFRYADRRLDETEFFIRKAIGWVLRDMSKRRPALVRDWLAPRTQRASGVTMREAVKYLDPADREALMAAYRDHRPAVLGSLP